MATVKNRVDFVNTEEGKYIKKVLIDMTDDNSYNTASCYSPNTLKYPDNIMSFIDKHISYISSHPELDARIYIMNLKMMTKISN